jgi:hypothetical protein
VYLGFTGSTGSLTETLQISNFFFGPATTTPPTARDDYVLANGGTMVIDVLANDDPSFGRLRVNDVSTPRFGIATVLGDGTIHYEVESSAAFPGEDWFTYDVMDSTGNVSAKANVHISTGLRAGTYVAALEVGAQVPAKFFLLKVTMSSSGALTAKLSRGGAKDVTLRGAFDSLGSFKAEVFEDFTLSLTRNDAPGAITVFLRSKDRFGGAARETALRTAAPKTAGSYTGIVADSNAGDYGYGWHFGKAGADGSVRLLGQAMDGVPVAIGSQVNIRGVFAVQVPLYRGKGLLQGQVELGFAGSTNVGRQFRPAGLGGTYDAGFDEPLEFGSSLYVKPAPWCPIFGEAAGPAPVSVSVATVVPGEGSGSGSGSLQANQKVANFTGNLPKFQFTGVPGTGFFKGKYEHPTTKKGMPFSGVAIQPLGAVGLVRTPGTGAARISIARVLN